MKESTKKSLTIVYSILLIILAAIFTVTTAMPIVVFDGENVDYAEEYYTGSFTGGKNSAEDLEIGLVSIADFIINFSDVQKIVRVQAGTETVEEEERERLEEMLDEDDTFANTVRLFYAFGGLFDEDFNDETSDALETGKLGTGKMRLAVDILKIMLLVCILAVGIIFSIIIAIKFIIFLIKALIHINSDSDTDVDNRMDRFPFVSYTATMVMFYMIYAIVSKGAAMGMAIEGAMIIFIIVCILRAAKSVIFAEKERLLVIIKQAISAVTIVALVLLMFGFTGVNLVGEYEDVVNERSQMQYMAEIERLADSGKDEYEITKAAEDATATTNAIYTAVILPVALIGAMVIVGSLISAVERFANKKTKLKTGKLVPYKAMIGLAVFVLIIAIVPTVFAVNSKEALEESFKEGQFKIWYGEYKEEGTLLNIEYQLLGEFVEDGKEEVAELRDKLKTADEEKAEEIQDQIEDAEELIAEADERISEIEARATRPTTCIVAGVLFLIAEIGYEIASKKTKKKDEEPTPAEIPAETPAETPAEAPAEAPATEPAPTAEA